MIRFDDVHRFLAEEALPFWSTTGAYPNGCFVEHLDLAGRPVDPGYTRTRAQARQNYVFNHAGLAGFAGYEDLCARSMDFFLAAAWLGPERGWVRRFDRNGALIDPTSDLYDIAFALFAIAWRFRATREPRLLALAHETLDHLDRTLGHPAGGYRNDAEASFPRQQNPHMHLAEAMNAWFEASGEGRFLERGTAIVDLMETRFSDPATGALGEFFDEDWRPVAGPQGQLVEPGHQFEWAWIIAHHGRLSGRPRPALTRRLIDSALAGGFDDATGLTIDQVDRAGKVVAASRRLWPQTETLKALLARGEFLGEWQAERIARSVAAILDGYLAPAPVRGTWLEHFDAQGRLIVDKIPSTSLYHVALAFFELLRLRETIEGVTGKA